MGRGFSDPVAAAPEPPVRAVSAGLRRLFVVAGGLVVIVGSSLFFASEQTDRNFAWTIATPLTAAFLGAAYLAAAVFEWTTATERVWARARVSVSAVLVFTVLTLIATLLHLDRFHFGPEHRFITRLGTWLWTFIYVVVPLVMVLLLLRQRRAPGADPPRAHPLPSWLRAVLAAQAAVLLAVGAAMFAVPTDVQWLWPWPITALTGRAIAAWLLGIGVGMVHAFVENDLGRIRVAGVSNVAIALLQFVALARYPGDVTSGPKATLYVLYLASMLAVGVYVLAAGRRPRPGPAGVPATSYG